MNEDLLQISFEFFPPKTLEAVEHLYDAAAKLIRFSPNFFSVTFGAGGSTRDGTLETVKMLQEQTPIDIAPHLSCIGSNRQELIDVIKHYQSVGVKRIVALRGDLPSGMGQAGEFKYASELVRLIRKETGNHFHIAVAAYPEIHPQAHDAQSDILSLKKKYDEGADIAITQYFFNPDAYFYFLDDCIRYDIQLPIIPGIMPITQFNKLARFSDICGAEIPRWIRKRLESYGDDVESVKAFGHEVVYDLCETLMLGGAPGLHFYTLNKAEATETLLTMLGRFHENRLPFTHMEDRQAPAENMAP